MASIGPNVVLAPKNNTTFQHQRSNLKSSTKAPNFKPHAQNTTKLHKASDSNENTLYQHQKKLLDLCLEHNAFTDLATMCEKIIRNCELKSTTSSKLYGYAVYCLAKSLYLRGCTKQAKLVFDQYDMPNSKCRLLQAQCLFDMGKFSQVQIAIVGSKNLKLLQPAEEILDLPELQQRFDVEQLPFALRLLAYSFMKMSKPLLARQTFKLCHELFPFLWTSLDGFLSTFSSTELLDLPSSTLFDFHSVQSGSSGKPCQIPKSHNAPITKPTTRGSCRKDTAKKSVRSERKSSGE